MFILDMGLVLVNQPHPSIILR